MTIAELLQTDGSGGSGHCPDIWPSVVTRTGHGVELRKEAILSGAHEKKYLFLTKGPEIVEKCKISHLKDQKVLGTCVGKVEGPVQKMLEVGWLQKGRTGGRVFRDREHLLGVPWSLLGSPGSEPGW